MAAVRSEVELMTGESLPPTVTMSSALALVAPALSQVVLAELMPAGFQYTPAGCGSSVITLERTVTPATDIAVRPATDVAANTAVGAGRPIAIS
jgi:hypothetical protein